MLYFLDDIIQEMIVSQSHNLFSQRKLVAMRLSQISVHSYFKVSSHGYSILTKVTSSKQTGERKEKGNVLVSILFYISEY